MTNVFDGGDSEQGPLDDFLARFFGEPFAGGPRRIDLGRLMSAQAHELMAAAAGRAMQAGSPDLDTDHMLWAVTRVEPSRTLLARAGIDLDRLADQLGGKLSPTTGRAPTAPPALTPAAKRALLDAHRIARALGSSYIGPEHILLGMVVNPESTAGALLVRNGVTLDSIQRAVGERLTAENPPPSATPTLDQFGRDLTSLAREGQLDPVIGRDSEIEQTIEILSRRTKNNPVLIGEAGVGKTAIVEGLAQRIADGDVPETLRDRRVVQLDLVGMVAGTRYRGDFEERLKKVLDEIRAHSNELVVFVDELHTIVGAGGAEGAMDAGNVLKPALARGELHVVGATTLDEYRKDIEPDAALERRFQPVLVPEPSVEDTVAILRGLRDRYEAHHQVRYTDEALVAAAELADRYISDRFLPDKAIDLMDQAGARVRLRTRTPATDVRGLEQEVDQIRRDRDQAVANEHYERAAELRDHLRRTEERLAEARGGGSAVPEVTVADIAEVVSRRTGIPAAQLTQEERQRLAGLEEELHRRVVGQDQAVEAVAQAVRRSRAGLGDPNRPIGTFLFLGPTGVGKTELARALAEALFGDEDRMVRFDMSEFQERHTVSRLVGAPPGYVGYEEAGQLTEAVRRRPYSVVLLDEIEKAHPDVFNVLLQVMDDGRLTDAQGRTVDFKNAVLIMTSNLGSDLIAPGRGGIGYGTDGARSAPNLRDRLMPRLRDAFRPEFLNRIDEIIIFRQLERPQVRQITDLMLQRSRRRLHAQDIEVDFAPEAIDWLAERGFDPEFGARPLRRTIQREVDDRLANLLLAGTLPRGSRAVVGVRNGQFIVEQAEGSDAIDVTQTSPGKGDRSREGAVSGHDS